MLHFVPHLWVGAEIHSFKISAESAKGSLEIQRIFSAFLTRELKFPTGYAYICMKRE